MSAIYDDVMTALDDDSSSDFDIFDENLAPTDEELRAIEREQEEEKAKKRNHKYSLKPRPVYVRPEVSVNKDAPVDLFANLSNIGVMEVDTVKEACNEYAGAPRTQLLKVTTATGCGRHFTDLDTVKNFIADFESKTMTKAELCYRYMLLNTHTVTNVYKEAVKLVKAIDEGRHTDMDNLILPKQRNGGRKRKVVKDEET